MSNCAPLNPLSMLSPNGSSIPTLYLPSQYAPLAFSTAGIVRRSISRSNQML